MNWKDSWAIRVGGEYAANTDVTLRAGYAYGTNPVPASTIFPVFPAIVEHHVMLGGTYQVNNAMSVTLAYERALNKAQTAGAQSVIAQEYNNSVSQLSENIFHLSMSYALK